MDRLHQDIRSLTDFLLAHPRLVVLTGAGISAESGIPTYRDEAGTWLHRTPIQEQAFLTDVHTRRRYWARSWQGWPVIRDALPTPAHRAIVQLQEQGQIELLITQNVDGLHQKAGSRDVVDLHGRVDRVRCLVCGALHTRDRVQQMLAGANRWVQASGLTPRPDGDMDLPDEDLVQVTLPQCQHCMGDLMPDVVFFGGTIPGTRVAACMDALERADALLVIGSSLMVFSGYRFCREAHQLGRPIAIINPGITRADHIADLKLRSQASPLLTAVVERYAGRQLSPIRSR